MTTLIFDVETTGLPTKWNAKIDDTNAWPYIVQFSWLLYDTETMDLLKMEDHLIKLDGMEIPAASTKIHGITTEMVNEKGKDIKQILSKFYDDLNDSSIIVAHNLKFDKSMVLVESLRNKMDDLFDDKVDFCTMLYGEKLCGLTRKNYRNEVVSKFPKLIELYKKLFDEIPSNLHNSLYDVLVCFRCYYRMRFGKDILKEDDKFGGFRCF
tara:strand:+ start:1122 stop:1751 length:630 start_codon:yes stop_codon:yes gene_type:complete